MMGILCARDWRNVSMKAEIELHLRPTFGMYLTASNIKALCFYRYSHYLQAIICILGLYIYTIIPSWKSVSSFVDTTKQIYTAEKKLDLSMLHFHVRYRWWVSDLDRCQSWWRTMVYPQVKKSNDIVMSCILEVFIWKRVRTHRIMHNCSIS